MNKLKRFTAATALATAFGFVAFGATGSAAVASDDPADWKTTLSVKLALLDKLGADSLQIDVDTAAGAVNLSGSVDKRETVELAGTVAKSVDGVKSVDNDVVLEGASTKPKKVAAEAEAEVKDAVLETKIRLALVDKMGTDGFKVGTEAASGVVTLEFAKDFGSARRQEAISVVRGVSGVSKVLSVDKG
jgi:hyperosmotically inducible protein